MSNLLQPDILSRAESLGVKARQLVEGIRVGDHKSPYRGFSVEFVQHREYVPGDDIKHIDWKSYGRSDRYTIKQYEQETNFIGHLLVDTSNSMRYGEGDTNKLEHAKLLAASLTYLIVKQRDSVAFRTFDHEWRDQLPTGSQMGHINKVCHALEAAEARDKTGMGRLLTLLNEQVSRRGIVILISDCFDDIPELLKGLQQLRFRGHEVILFHIMHRDEVELPIDGNIRFLNLEGADQLLARPHLLRPAYQRVVGEWLKNLERSCDRSRIDYVRLLSDEPLQKGLSAYLVRRLQASKK